MKTTFQIQLTIDRPESKQPIDFNDFKEALQDAVYQFGEATPDANEPGINKKTAAWSGVTAEVHIVEEIK